METYAITLQQPWAYAVFHLGKDVENRSWTIKPGSRILIHAGKTVDQEGVRFITEVLGLDLPSRAYKGGVILGSVQVTDVTRGRHRSPWANRGMYHWELSAPRKASPQIICRGFPALWRPPAGWEQSFNRKKVA